MNYVLSKKYDTPELQKKIMGPNPVKLAEELLEGNQLPERAVVCDLGSGQGLTSVFLAKEYGFTVYAVDLWSEPSENQRFFCSFGHFVPSLSLVLMDVYCVAAYQYNNYNFSLIPMSILLLLRSTTTSTE